MEPIIKERVRTVATHIPSDVYEKFRYKSYEEGYSMQQSLSLLIEQYVATSSPKNSVNVQ